MNRHPALLLAAVVGVIHGAFSLYWAFGGTWLLETIAVDASSLEGLGWLVVLIGLAKIAFALIPLTGDIRTITFGNLRTYGRSIGYLGMIALIVYGGVNTVGANLVLGGIIPRDDYDLPSMIGHAWLWDPLFLLWGVLLLIGLLRTRRPREERTSPGQR